MPLVVWPTAGANSYVSLADANTYFGFRIGADGWTAATDDVKNAALATATSLLDMIGWAGEPTDPTQPLGWPRTGVANVADDTLPPAIVKATEELALALVNNPALADWTGTGSNIRSLGAGPASIAFFTFVDGTPFPAVVMQIIGPYRASGSLSGISGAGGTEVFGNEDCSQFPPWRDERTVGF